MYCIGCGKELKQESGTCPDCQCPVRGHVCRDAVAYVVDVDSLPQWRTPTVCACCLNPAEVTDNRKVSLFVIKSGFTRRKPCIIPIPWCSNCYSLQTGNRIRRAVLQFFLWLVAVPVGLGIAVLIAAGLESSHMMLTPSGMALAFVAVIVAAGTIALAIASPFLLVHTKYLARQGPGHVRSCLGVLEVVTEGESAAGKQEQRISITFGSKAFAARWKELNPCDKIG